MDCFPVCLVLVFCFTGCTFIRILVPLCCLLWLGTLHPKTVLPASTLIVPIAVVRGGHKTLLISSHHELRVRVVGGSGLRTARIASHLGGTAALSRDLPRQRQRPLC